MKRNFIIILVTALGFGYSTYAQNPTKKIEAGKAKKAKVEANYARSSLTLMLLDFGNTSPMLKKAFNNLNVPSKYDDNNSFFANRIVKAPFKQVINDDDDSKEAALSLKDKLLGKPLFQPDSIDNILTQFVSSKGYANDLLYYWWGIKEDGSYPKDNLRETTIAKRGLYNAKTKDRNIALATKRGMEDIADAGAGLIGNSHILFLEFKDIKPVDDENMNGYTATVTGYLYKLNYNDEMEGDFFDSYDGDKFNRTKFLNYMKNFREPFLFVIKTTATATGKQLNADNPLMKNKPQQTDQQLMNELAENGLYRILFYITRSYEPFKVKTYVKRQGKKILAESGRKEGLTGEQRYFVWEYKQKTDKENNVKSEKYVRKGVVRVKKAAHNEATDNALSEFYQVAGKKLDNGWIMQQNEDLGFGIIVGYGIGSIGGINGRLEYNASRMINKYINFPVPALKLWGELGFQGKSYEADFGDGSPLPEEKYTFTRFVIGLSKEFYFLRNYQFTPYIGYGAESVSWKDKPKNASMSGALLDFGGQFSANILYNLQAVLSAEYYLPMGLVNYKVDKTEITVPLNWSKVFPGRSGLTINIGIRYQF